MWVLKNLVSFAACVMSGLLFDIIDVISYINFVSLVTVMVKTKIDALGMGE